MENMPGVRSITVGIWVKVGARFEKPEKNGISHFLEHMFFKGTKNRSQKEIAIDIDSLGGDINAFTSRESTTYYVKVLNDFVSEAIDILSDIFTASLFREEDIGNEKKIILEELRMVEDTPDDLIHDLFFEDIWGDQGLGMPVLGREETINTFTRPDIQKHIGKYYGTKDVIISCAGKVDFKEIPILLEKSFGKLRKGTKPALHSNSGFKGNINVYKKDLSDVHLCLGVEGISQNDVRRYPFLFLNTIIGSGISSRLFQEIRENMGLVYTIYSFLSSYHDTGVFGIYTATAGERYVDVTERIIQEIRNIKESLTTSEVDKAKSQLKGNLMLALESSSGRMNNIARQEIYYGRYYSPSEIIKNIEKIQLQEVRDIAADFIDNKKFAVTVLGPADESELRGIN